MASKLQFHLPTADWSGKLQKIYENDLSCQKFRESKQILIMLIARKLVVTRPRAKFWVSSAARQKNLKLCWLCNFSTFENFCCLSLTLYTVKYQTFTYKNCIFRRRLWRSLFSQCTEPLNGIKIAFLLLYANLSPSELFAPRPEHRPSTTSGSWLGRGI